MIEFTGQISGKADKFYWKKVREFGVLVVYIPVAFILAVVLLMSINSGDWTVFPIVLGICVLCPPVLFLPRGKKEKQQTLPTRIYTEDEYIICKNDHYEQYSLISAAIRLEDHGEFYYIVMPKFNPNFNDKFICQKNLLTKGTLEEFEGLFEGKIVRFKK